MQLKAILRDDLSAYRQSVPGKSPFGYYRMFPGFKFCCWLRLYGCLKSKRIFILRILASLAARKLQKIAQKHGIQINPETSIKGGLYIPHSGGIVVNPRTQIGKNCYLSHNVTIGKAHTGAKAGVPTIGNDVFIGPGAVLLGNIKIGDNSAIGANSVALEDVPSGVFAAGAPAKMITEKSASQLLGRSTIIE
jgi:serine O-acetyltransferase